MRKYGIANHDSVGFDQIYRAKFDTPISRTPNIINIDPQPVDFANLITTVINTRNPTALTSTLQTLLETFPDVHFQRYEYKVMCALVDPSILLNTSPFFDTDTGFGQHLGMVHKRLLSSEFGTLGAAFMTEAIKVQIENTRAAWKAHNDIIASIYTETTTFMHHREERVERLARLAGDRHPIVQVLRGFIEAEGARLSQCFVDNKFEFDKHCHHLAALKNTQYISRR